MLGFALHFSFLTLFFSNYIMNIYIDFEYLLTITFEDCRDNIDELDIVVDNVPVE